MDLQICRDIIVKITPAAYTGSEESYVLESYHFYPPILPFTHFSTFLQLLFASRISASGNCSCCRKIFSASAHAYGNIDFDTLITVEPIARTPLVRVPLLIRTRF